MAGSGARRISELDDPLPAVGWIVEPRGPARPLGELLLGWAAVTLVTLAVASWWWWPAG